MSGMEGSTGKRVAQLRRQAGLSQGELARRLHRSLSWVQKIEQGTRELSDVRLIEELAGVLGVSRAEILGEDTAIGAPDIPAEEMQRQAFLQGLGALTLTGEDFSSRDLPYRTDAALMASLVEGTETLERLYGHVTPGALQGLVLGHLEALTSLLRGSPGKYRRELLSLAGETAVLAGWVALDRGKDDRALFYFDSALRAAADGSDQALSVYAMGSATTVPTFRERSPRSVINALTNGARGVLSVEASRSTAAWIATLEASAYASVGERDNALHALARAEEIFETASDTLPSARPRVEFFDRGRLAGEQGIIRLELANTRPDVAGRYLRTALIEIDPKAKIRARFLTALASIHADNDDVEGACRYAADAWRVGLETETVRSLDQVRELRRTKLVRWESSEAVRILDDILATQQPQ